MQEEQDGGGYGAEDGGLAGPEGAAVSTNGAPATMVPARARPLAAPAGVGSGSLPAGWCSRCGASHGRGALFCPSCRVYLEAPDVGKLASPKRRLAASILDSVFQDGGLIGSVLGPLLIGTGAAHGIVALLSMVYWGLTLYLWSKGTTPAKRALDMEVVREDGEPAGFLRMAFRETIGKAISWGVLGLGILSVAVDRDHQGWHDKMVGTYVVKDDER
jgi:uncharacterized RDD family membrane protein YckC